MPGPDRGPAALTLWPEGHEAIIVVKRFTNERAVVLLDLNLCVSADL